MVNHVLARRKASRRAAQLALAAALMLAPAHAAAGDTTTTLFADAVGRYGPAGVMVSAGGALRWPQGDGPSPLSRGRYAQLGVSVGVNPAYAQGSIAGEWVPIAPLQLRLQYDAFEFFGANGALLELPSAGSKFGSAELDALRGTERRGIGHRLMFSPVVRARVGRVVLRSQTDVDWYALSRTSGWYYEWENDTLLARTDWLVANRTAVMAELWRGAGDATLLAGPMYDVTRAGAARIVRQRAGASAYWAPAARWLGFDRPRVYALAGVNLSDRNRPGEPFVVLGFGGDLDVGAR
jgi:hypothetical protein